jgi:hypothetical protein
MGLSQQAFDGKGQGEADRGSGQWGDLDFLPR